MRTAKPGYIIMLTLLIIAAAVALISAVVSQAFSYQRQARLVREKAQARMLILSSLELASSKLSHVIEKEKEEKKKAEEPEAQKKEALDPLQKWLLEVLPVLNRWQKFEFKEETDELEGSVSLYITSEDGKINLRSFDDQMKGEESTEKESGPKKEEAGEPKKAPQETKRPLDRIDELFKNEKGVGIKDALL
jgi:type II secretory pathway component PulK